MGPMARRSASVLVRATCACGTSIPVGAIGAIRCPDCERTIEIDYGRVWADVLHAAETQPHARAESICRSLVGAVDRADVVCPTCSAIIPDERIDGAFRERANSLSCPSCAGSLGLRTRLDIKGGTSIIPVDSTWAAVLAETHEADVKETSATINVPCSSCGAPLTIDGTTRSPTCTFCGVQNLLSDESWHALHPSARGRPFFLWRGPSGFKQPLTDDERARAARKALATERVQRQSDLEAAEREAVEDRRRSVIAVAAGIFVVLGGVLWWAIARGPWSVAPLRGRLIVTRVWPQGTRVTVVSKLGERHELTSFPADVQLLEHQDWSLTADGPDHAYRPYQRRLSIGQAPTTMAIILDPLRCAEDGSSGCVPRAVVKELVNAGKEQFSACYHDMSGFSGIPVRVDRDGHVVLPDRGSGPMKPFDVCVGNVLRAMNFPPSRTPTFFTLNIRSNYGEDTSVAVAYD